MRAVAAMARHLRGLGPGFRKVTVMTARSARRILLAVLLATTVTWASVGPAAAAEAPVDLGSADEYSVLAGSTVTNTGPSTLNRSLGVSPGSAATGFPPGLVGGDTNLADADADGAQLDLTAAYEDAATRPSTGTIVGDTLGGLVLGTGVYSGGALDLTGVLTLDGAGDPDAVFIFQAASSLVTAGASSVVLINDAQPCNVFWQVTSSATLGGSTAFAGTIMALQSITAVTGATIDGRLLARNAAVTLDTNTITSSVCAAAAPTTTTTTTSTTSTAAPSSTTTSVATTPTTAATSPTIADSTSTTVAGGVVVTTTPQGTGTDLPRTGSTLEGLALAGLVGIALGGILVAASRRGPAGTS